MPTLTIDNQAVTVPEGKTLLEAAGALGIEIPTLCHVPGRAARQSCFVCVVKLEGRAGLAPACATKAAEGMVVDASGPEVRQARRTALELLLSDHVGDCVAPCQRAHPERASVPRVLRLVKAGEWEKAAALLGEDGRGPTAENAESAETKEKKEAEKGAKGPRWENACRRAQIDEAIAIDAMLRHVKKKGQGTAPAQPHARGQAAGDGFTVVIGKLHDDEKQEFMKEADARGRVRIEPGKDLTDEEAMAEAGRCLHCDCRKPVSCRLRRWAKEYGARHGAFRGHRRSFRQDRSHGRVIFEAGKCIACGQCVQVTAERNKELGLGWSGRGYDVRPAGPLGATIAEALGEAAEECVKVCPTGALAWGEEEEEED